MFAYFLFALFFVLLSIWLIPLLPSALRQIFLKNKVCIRTLGQVNVIPYLWIKVKARAAVPPVPPEHLTYVVLGTFVRTLCDGYVFGDI